jgi:hypothetical protein
LKAGNNSDFWCETVYIYRGQYALRARTARTPLAFIGHAGDVNALALVKIPFPATSRFFFSQWEWS